MNSLLVYTKRDIVTKVIQLGYPEVKVESTGSYDAFIAMLENYEDEIITVDTCARLSRWGQNSDADSFELIKRISDFKSDKKFKLVLIINNMEYPDEYSEWYSYMIARNPSLVCDRISDFVVMQPVFGSTEFRRVTQKYFMVNEVESKPDEVESKPSWLTALLRRIVGQRA